MALAVLALERRWEISLRNSNEWRFFCKGYVWNEIEKSFRDEKLPFLICRGGNYRV